MQSPSQNSPNNDQEISENHPENANTTLNIKSGTKDDIDEILKPLNEKLTTLVSKVRRGQAISADQIMKALVPLYTPDIGKKLLAKALTNDDINQLLHKTYCETESEVSFDNFLGLLRDGSILPFIKRHKKIEHLL